MIEMVERVETSRTAQGIKTFRNGELHENRKNHTGIGPGG